MVAGKKCRLRAIERADLPKIVQWRNQPEVAHGFFHARPLALAQQERWYEAQIADSTQLNLLIETLEGESIGAISLYNMDFLMQTAEFGRFYIGEREFLGRGYARDAALALLRYGFRELGLYRIYLEVFTDNERAIRLYESLGFRREGIKRQAVWARGARQDVTMMGLLCPEFCEGEGEP